MSLRLFCCVAFLVLPAGAAISQESGSAVRGHRFALDTCAECHAVEPGIYESPVYEAPSFAEIADSEDMSSVALIPFFQTSHPTMPNFVIPADNIRDLSAYLLSLRH
jgi:mono/diheme cytochrome c family protein